MVKQLLPFFCVICVLSDATGANATEGNRASRPEVLLTIDSAARNARLIPGYVATTYEVINGNEATMRKYVRNGPGRLHLARTEIKAQPRPGKPVAITYITNESGIWKIEGSQVTRLAHAPNLRREPPLRLATADLLQIKDDFESTIEENTRFFGTPATKITISVSTQLAAKLKENPDILKQAVRKQLTKNSAALDEKTFERSWLAMAESQFPVRYVYFVAIETPFILSWQAYSFTGKKVAEISYQEFKIDRALPDSLFAVPSPATKSKATPAPETR